MIHSDAHCRMMLLTDIQERNEFTLYLLQFVGIFFISIFKMFERATGINIVSGIDSHLLAVLRRNIGSMCSEVNIGNKRSVISLCAQCGRYILHVLCLTNTLRGEAHQFASGINNTLCLLHRCLGIVSVCGCHRLDTDRIITTDSNITDFSYRS